MKKFLIVLAGILWFSAAATAQIEHPVSWRVTAKQLNAQEADLIVKATIQPGWHVYSQFLKAGGPVPTSFTFRPSPAYQLVGKVAESPQPVAAFDQNFNMEILWHEQAVTFRQRIKLLKPVVSVTGSVEFMVCNDQKCLPPTEETFEILLGAKPSTASSDLQQAKTTRQERVEKAAGTGAAQGQAGAADASPASYAGIFIAGFLGGLAAFFMPCIYPLIPLTVSFFTKQAGSRRRGIQQALLYGLSIISIYVALGVLITLSFGASALNEAASSALFNLFFFAVLVMFALSFLGAFELVLPSALVNKMDEKSSGGGLAGLFFMAFTLALVSFSCTGPIIGTLLVDAVSKGTYLGPAIGMFGFSLALAFPFTFFAIFPAWLRELPKSGGWLQTVKVSLGFLELALAFKYLSNVDLAYHWGIFNRDLFLIVWIVIFGVLGLYLLGKLPLTQEAAPKQVSLPRLIFSMIVFVFTLYMIPGIWGAPLKLISAWLPPITTQEFDLTGYRAGGAAEKTAGKKYASLFHTPYGLNAFYDYEQARVQSKKENKPILLDFTGWSCTNCRKMEASVWSDPLVLARLKKEFVLVSLYVDDKTELAENEKYTSVFSGRKVKTVGQKWSDFQASAFGTNSQPYYVIVNAAGEKLTHPKAFDLNIQNYLAFLAEGKAAFSSMRLDLN
ncbi:protein-disulfide reductase DsbD family protein [Pontibacter liquoris]|uniref:protein-disulfide reductase DsbD family protein n=1 Tax=Pontibacter liquoris TaxID=2905677 RepID=UPI001FA72285|nr:thioredoxin family protein [Pontibacter liquoris]